MTDAVALKQLIEAAHLCRKAGSDVLKITDFWPLVDAAEAHLATLPRTRMVEVWRVEWAQASHPFCVQQESQSAADEYAEIVRTWIDASCIRVTGPFQQEVPEA